MNHIDWAHVARATLWSTLAILAYAVVVLLIARLTAWVGAHYRRVDFRQQQEVERQTRTARDRRQHRVRA